MRKRCMIKCIIVLQVLGFLIGFWIDMGKYREVFGYKMLTPCTLK